MRPPASMHDHRAARSTWAAVCCATALLTPATRVHAHAFLSESWASLPSVVVKANAPQTFLKLRFSGVGNMKDASVELVPEKGETRKLKLGIGPGAGDVSTSLPPLPAGRYSLRYRVPTSDAHVSEDSVPLTVVGTE